MQIEADIDQLQKALDASSISRDVNRLMEKLYLNLNSLTMINKDIKPLLASIKKTILESNEDVLDYSLLINILDSIISICSFDDVLAIFSIEDLANGMKSKIGPLVKSVCKVIAGARPKDIFANTSLLDETLTVFFEEQTAVDIINEIEKTFAVLMNNELNRRRILENNSPTLMKAKNVEHSTSFCRLLDLLQLLFEDISFEEFRKDLFIVDQTIIEQVLSEDILIFIHICKYYIGLLDVASSSINKQWSIRYLSPVFTIFGEAFAKREENEDVEHFAKTYLFQIFSRVSYLDDFSYITALEDDYFPLSSEKSYTTQLLTTLNPRYVASRHLQLLQGIQLKASNVEMFKNLVNDEVCFNQLKNEITTESVLAIPYLQEMYFLAGLTSHSYGIHHLTQNMPGVMNLLINRTATERVCFLLRQKVFENLLDATPQELSIWLIPVQSEYANIINGNIPKSSKYDIASDFL